MILEFEIAAVKPMIGPDRGEMNRFPNLSNVCSLSIVSSTNGPVHVERILMRQQRHLEFQSNDELQIHQDHFALMS